MVNLFGIDVTDNSDNSRVNISQFITKTTPPELAKRLEMAEKDMDDLLNKANPSSALTLLTLAAFIVGGFLFLDFFLSFMSNGVNAFRDNSLKLVIAVCCGIFVLTAVFISNSKKKKLTASDEFNEKSKLCSEAFDDIKRELGIPDDAVDIEFLASKYKMKNNEPKHVNYPSFSHANIIQSVFVRDSALCFSTYTEVAEIPLSSLKSTSASGKKASFSNWYKSIPYNAPQLKKYKISMSNNVYFTKYYVVDIHDPKGDFVLLIPNYDFESFAELTHIQLAEV